MKKFYRGLLAALLVISLLISLCPAVFAAPSSTLITTPATGYDSADDVVYKESNGYLINWGARGEKCDFLTTYGQDFYTGSYDYGTLSKVTGGTSATNAHTSSLYTSLQALMTDRHTYLTKYDSSSSADCKPLYENADCYGNDITYVSTLYRGLKVGGAWDGGKSYNQEHVWPKSKLRGTKYTDIGDIMALRAANPNENSSRNNTAYGESAGYYDPGVSVRGDCARTLLYMYVRWGNTDTLWGTDGAMESLDIMLRWIQEDPVDTWEMAHNDVVESITGTRNAFVDYPEYAWLLFGRSIPEGLDTPTDGGAGGSVTDTASATQLVTNVSDLRAGDRIIIAALNYDYALSAEQRSANRGQAAISKTTNGLSYTTDTQILTLTAGTASGSFGLQAGDGQYLYASSSSANQLKTKSTLDANGSWRVSIGSNGAASITACGSATRNVLRYNATSGLFSCYAAANSQKDVCIYKLISGGSADSSCSHSYTSKITTAAGCTSTGVRTYTCSMCGDSYTATISATGHSYTDRVTTMATCTSTGVRTYTCSSCGYSYTTTIPVMGHSFSGTTCTVCGYSTACSHSYSSSVTRHPTCTTSGQRDYLCTLCGDSYTETIPTTAHSYSGGKCAVCGAVDSSYSPDYYLFGYINGANYACEEDYTNVGSYRFVNGKLTASFEQDSYVAVKTGDNANWYMTGGWQGEVTSAVLYNTSINANPDKLFVPGGCQVTFTLKDNGDDSLTLSYVTAQCSHSYTSKTTTAATCTENGVKTYTCSKCGYYYTETIPAAGHKYASGKCSVCGKVDSAYHADYYLFGFINGANYACEEDHQNLGQYKFVDGKLTATFETEGYVGVKTGDNVNWYMTSGWQGEVTSAVLYNTSINANPDKLYVPGGRALNFTLTVNADDTLVLSYEIAQCKHQYSSRVSVEPNCTNPGVRIYTCSLCADTYTESIAATGHRFSSGKCLNCGTKDPNCSHSFRSSVTTAATCTTTGVRSYLCDWCGYSYEEPIATAAHSYVQGKCSVCGAKDGSYSSGDYYLFGFINEANYGCEEDWENLGNYRFVGGKLTVTFETEGYVGVKTGDNENWYMTDGWQGIDATSVVLYNTSRGINADKLYVPGGVKLTFTLTPGGDDSLILSYVAEYEGCTHNYQEQITLAPTCTATGMKTFTCTSCGSAYSLEIPARGHSYSGSYCSACGLRDDSGDSYDYYLFGFINGADYGCESDYTTLGSFQFYSNGTCSATFASDSYVGVKKVEPASGQVVGWYMTDGWQGTDTTSAKLYSTDVLGGNADKLYVPGGLRVCFTLVPQGDGTMTLRYADVDCSHRFDGGVTTTRPGCSTQGEKTYTCTDCGHYYTEAIVPTGHSCTGGQCKNCGVADPNYGKSCCSGKNHTYTLKSETLPSCTSAGSRTFRASCGATYTETLPALGHSYNSRVTAAATCALPGLKTFSCACGATYTQPIDALGHRYQNGTCTVCGAAESSGTVTEKAYYLFGFINGMDYGCGDDWENPGEYKFVGDQLTVTFETDSYVAVKTGDNLNWFMAQNFVSGNSATLYDTATGVYEKLLVPGGVQVTFTLVENADGTLELSYTTTGAGSSVILPNFTLKYPSLSFKDEVKLNVYFNVTDTDSVVDMGLIVFSSKVDSYTVYNAEDVVAGYQYSSSAGLYCASTHGIPAKNMGDTVWFAVYAQLSNGTYHYSKLVDYSPRTYAYTMLGSGDAKLDALLVAMLNYGTAAQTYFGYNTGSLLNNQLTSAQKALVTAYSKSMMPDIAAPGAYKQGSFAANGGFQDKYPSVTFGGAFAINYYCVPSYVPARGVTMYYWTEADYNAASVLTSANATGAVKMTGSGTYRGSVTGISAKDLGDGVYVAFVYSDGSTTYCSGVLQYSIGMYCTTMAGYQNDFTPFAKATAVYGYYAKQYFG